LSRHHGLLWTEISELVRVIMTHLGDGGVLFVTAFGTWDPDCTSRPAVGSPIDGGSDRSPRDRGRTYLEPGELLFAQGSRGGRIFVIESGEIDIIRELSGAVEEHLATLGPGEHFGEMGPLFGMARSATARARSATKVSGYTPEQFRVHVGVERLTDIMRSEIYE
ncbi:MAG: cyclic nucleotide-binding domain-containing protein, partial [Acidimicrobiales bacterium]